MLKSMNARAAVGLAVVVATGLMFATATPASADPNPQAAACRSGGWRLLHNATDGEFRNQGDCISYVNGGGAFLQATCMNSTTADARFTGPIDTLNNLSNYESTDGTCSLNIFALQTIVDAPDNAAATAKCAAVDAGSAFNQLFNFISGVPATYWICTRIDFVNP